MNENMCNVRLKWALLDFTSSSAVVFSAVAPADGAAELKHGLVKEKRNSSNQSQKKLGLRLEMSFL